MTKISKALEAALLRGVHERGGTIGKKAVLPAAPTTGAPTFPPPPGRSWSIFIPGWVPPSLNKLIGTNRFVVHKLKKDAADQLAIGLMQCPDSIPLATRKRRLHLELTWSRKSWRGDADNFWKVVKDFLVQRQLLVDDSTDWVECTEPLIRVGKKSTLITLEEWNESPPTPGSPPGPDTGSRGLE